MNFRRFFAILALSAALLAASACADGVRARDVRGACVLITKSAGNAYNECLAKGFCGALEASGQKVLVLEPEKATVEAQVSLVQACIRGRARSIAIAANSKNALDSVLRKAMDAGIPVSTVDSNTGPDSHAVFVNQVSSEDLARCLMDSVYDLTGGEGAWAILSTTNQVGNQSAWIRVMQQISMEDKYRNLRLVQIAFGEDDLEKSREKTRLILQKHPDVKAICSPTVVGMRAAAEVLRESASGVKLTGLGLPSEMEDYMTGDDPVCPVMYLWDPAAVGNLSAEVSMALVGGTISGAVGETFQTRSGQLCTVTDDRAGGSEVIVGDPIRFTAENIEVWRNQF